MQIIRNVLFFLLSFISGFFSGMLIAGMVDAGRGQMLAGGAIVLGYGVIGSIIGLVLAIAIKTNYKRNTKVINLLNKILAVFVLLSFLWFYMKFQQRESFKNQKTNTPIEEIDTEK